MTSISNVDVRAEFHGPGAAPTLRQQSPTVEQSPDVYPGGRTYGVDESGASFLLVTYGSGENAGFAQAWLNQAAATGPVQWLTFADFNAEATRQLSRTLQTSHNGLRIMIAGPQFDVLQTTALARCGGALEKEIRSFVTDTAALPVYCAHCRETSRVTGGPGDVVTCPACARTIEIHDHLSGTRGSYLASDALARELP